MLKFLCHQSHTLGTRNWILVGSLKPLFDKYLAGEVGGIKLDSQGGLEGRIGLELRK